MKHWHECSICKEYFECACGVTHRVLAFCEDCPHSVRPVDHGGVFQRAIGRQ